MVVSQHHPEAAQGLWRDADAERGQVALQEGGDVILAPLPTGAVIGRQKRRREAAPLPQWMQRFGTGFAELQRCQLEMADPPGQGFGGLADQVARGTAEDEEARRIPGTVDKHAQEREQLRGTLDLVDDDQPAQPLQGQLGLGQGREVGRVFQVKAGDRGVGQAVGVHACQRGLAALPRAEQRDHRHNREAGRDLRQVSVTFHA